MTLIDLLKQEVAETKHYEVCIMDKYDPSIRCRHGFWLCKIGHDHINYKNRHGEVILYAADPHFFDKLRKLLTELCKRQQRTQRAFEKKMRGQT